MRLLILLILFLSQGPSTTSVRVVGSMRQIMREGNLSASVALDTLNLHHLYALGPVENLKGEILVLDGKVYVSALENDKVITKQIHDVHASMLVYCYVANWKTFSNNHPVKNLSALEELVKKSALQHGMDISKSFPFLLHSKTGAIQYHIIDWREGLAHAPENHKQFAKSGELQDEEVTLLGFYAAGQPGIFTHHTSNTHLHLITQHKTLIAHVDDLSWGEFDIQLPAQ